LAQKEEKLISVENKWIQNHITHETYNRWYTNITHKRINLKAQIERLSQDQTQLYTVMYENLELLTDLKFIYSKANSVNKQELIRMGFDNNLYYRNGMYRTPAMMEIFTHNILIMKERKLLEIDGQKKGI
jgi:site-specific DNA recombinase